MKEINNILTNYKLHNTSLVFEIPYLNKDNILKLAAIYSFISFNEKEVIQKMIEIEKNCTDFKSWIKFEDAIRFKQK